MKTAVATPDPYDNIAARYRRQYVGTMTDIATVMRKAGSLVARR